MEYSVSTLKTNTIQAVSGSKVNIPGHIIQIVHAGNNTSLVSNATNTWFEYLTATITPSSSSSKIFLDTTNNQQC